MKKLHYAWMNVLLCVLILFASGSISQTYGVFLPAIAEDLGASMSQVSMAVTILNAVMAVCGPLAASLVNRYGMRRVFPLAYSCLACSLVLLSCSHSLALIYVLYAACGCCLYFGLFYICPYIVNRWFRTRVAETIALIITAMAVGGVIGNLVLSAFIAAFTWRAAYRFQAAFILLVAFLAAVLLRNHPNDMGLEPYGTDRGRVKEDTNKKGGLGLTLKAAMREPAFYLVVLYVACMQFCVGMQSQIPALAISFGLASAVGAAAASVNSLGGIIAKALLSVFNVRLGVVKAVMLYNGIGIAGLLAVLMSDSAAALYSFAVFFGFAIGSTTVQLPLLSNRLFGASEDYDKIHARIVLLSGLAATPSAVAAGAVYDLTGSYRLMLCILILLLTAAVLLAGGAWAKANFSRFD